MRKSTVEYKNSRKEFVEALAAKLGVAPKYLGAPTFAYQVGPFKVCRERAHQGEIEADDTMWDTTNADEVAPKWIAYGEAFKEQEMACLAGFDGLPCGQEPEPGPTSEPAVVINLQDGTVREPQAGTIWMPWMEPDEFAKLEAIVASKHDLICKAIGRNPADGLYLQHGGEGEQIGFPWFTQEQIEYNGEEYLLFVGALCRLAETLHRVTAKQKTVPNEKYAFRCFLLRLGFIGEKYSKARKVLLANLEGNGAWRQPKGGDEQ